MIKNFNEFNKVNEELTDNDDSTLEIEKGKIIKFLERAKWHNGDYNPDNVDWDGEALILHNYDGDTIGTYYRDLFVSKGVLDN